MNKNRALALLKSGGLDAEHAHLRAWLGEVWTPAGRKGLRALLSLRADGAWGAALRGRALSLAGRPAPALRRLERARAALPGEPLVLAWLGELALAAGDLDRALADLDAAIALDPRRPWAYAYRAAARFRRGDGAGALADAAVVSRLLPRSPAGHAVGALIAAPADPAAARARLRLGMARSKPAWALALRALLAEEPISSDWPALRRSRRDLDKALSAADSPLWRVQRARVCYRMTDFKDYAVGLDDLNRATRAYPRALEVQLAAAELHYGQAQLPEAERTLTRVLGLSPSAPAYARRARLRALRHELPLARRDIEAACRLEPANAEFKAGLVRLLLLQDDEKALERALGDGVPAGPREYWRGVLQCRRRRFGEARRRFALAERLDGGGMISDLRRKAEFSRWVALILENAPAPRPPEGRELLILGTGFRVPFQVSAATVEALAGCDVVFNNQSDREMPDFLALFPIPVKAIPFGSQRDAESARQVVAGLGSARRAATITRASPQVLGAFATNCYLQALRRGIRCRFYESLTLFDLLSAAPEGDVPGLQVRIGADVRGVDPRVGLVLYEPLARGPGPLRALARSYPPGRRLSILHWDAGDEARVPATMSRLAEEVMRIGEGCVVHVPGGGR